MSVTVTAAVAVAEAPVDSKTAVHDYIMHHVMYHMASADTWNVPFMHLKIFDIFSYDSFMVVFSAALLIGLVALFYRPQQDAPRGFTAMLELFVLFVRDKISIPFLGDQDGRKFTPLFCSLFVFILMMNLLGLIPLFSAATSNVNVTGALALVTLSVMVLGAIYRNGFRGFLRAFVPRGVPWPVLPILAPIEFISMIGKAFALMIRLFANMLAGHIIIFSLLGLVVIFGYYSLPLVLLVVCVFFFEIFVAFFQAYIFTLLSAVFIGQMFQPEH